MITALWLLLTSACSLNSSRSDDGADATQKLWYSCSASSSGEGWDCGSNAVSEKSDEVEITHTDTHVIGPATVTVTAISVEELKTPEATSNESGPIPNQEDVRRDVPQPEIEADVSGSAAIYTLQLGAFTGEAQRDRFIEDEALPAEEFDFRMVENLGRVWWVLTYGEYADALSANNRKLWLQEVYGLEGIWLRPLSDFMRHDTFSRPESENTLSAVSQEAVIAETAYYDPQYSVQLAAFQTEERRNQYIERQNLVAEALIFIEEQRGDEKWWILLYGEYTSVKEAREAQVYLGEKYGIADTWIKPRY